MLSGRGGRVVNADRIAAALVLLKSVDVLFRGPQRWPLLLWFAAISLWLVGAGLLLVASDWSRSRVAWSLVLLGGLGVLADAPVELRWQHTVLLTAVALGAVVARDSSERLLLWRIELSVLYGVAALAKVNESFLGGDVLARAVGGTALGRSLLPDSTALLLLAGGAVVLTELVLAVTPWTPRLRVPGTLLAAALHLGGLLLLSVDVLVGLRLLFFGGTAVLLHAASAGLVSLPKARPVRALR